MLKRLIARATGFGRPEAEEWNKLWDHGYRDVPRYVADARRNEKRREDFRSGGLFGRVL